MDTDFRIEKMTPEEVALAIDWAAKEGWNPGLCDASTFYQADPDGFFVGKLAGKVIAVGSAVTYDHEFAFCGLYIVDKAYRQQGYGMALTRAKLAYARSKTVSSIGIDGVINMVDKYAQIGYQFAHNNARFTFQGRVETPPTDPAIVPLTQVDFDALLAYDRRHFPALRDQFLRGWINQADSRSLAYIESGNVLGYGVIRTCREGFKIGPLFAETPIIADRLFIQLVNFANGQTVYLDIPENNPDAIALVNAHHMTKVFATVRMYMNIEPKIEIEHIYGITTFELG